MLQRHSGKPEERGEEADMREGQFSRRDAEAGEFDRKSKEKAVRADKPGENEAAELVETGKLSDT